MIHTADRLLNNTYLVSTNLRSFGFVICDADTENKKSTENFFELFRFSPNVAAKIFEALNSGSGTTVFAKDNRSNGFMFFQSTAIAGVFAFVKRIDIHPDKAATIIRSVFSDDVICLNGEKTEYCEEDFSYIASSVNSFISLLATNGKSGYKMHGMIASLTNASSKLSVELSDTNEFCGAEGNDYVFSPCGFALFVGFLCLSGANSRIKIHPHHNNCNIAHTQIFADSDLGSSLIPKLDFLRSLMDLQNLNLFYSPRGNEIDIIFLPYYIDDGLHGVKAPIDYLNIT